MFRTDSDAPKVNREIIAPNVLLVDEEGVKIGQVPTAEAVKMAEERSLDLVEVAPLAKPPVCRIMDYGKYRYQLQKREKDARRKQKVQTLKEIKMRPKIDDHDFNFKVRAVRSFLEDGHRVKVSIFFRGREMAFLSRGEEVLKRVVAMCEDLGKSEGTPKMEGRYMRLMLTPVAPPPKSAGKSVPRSSRDSEGKEKPASDAKPAAPESPEKTEVPVEDKQA